MALGHEILDIDCAAIDYEGIDYHPDADTV